MAVGDIPGARTLAAQAAESPVASLRARARILLADIEWIAGNWREATEQLEAALAEAGGDAELVARVYPKLVNYTVPHDPVRAVAHAEAAMGRGGSRAVSRRRLPRSCSIATGPG